jgi:hypothetical protein
MRHYRWMQAEYTRIWQGSALLQHRLRSRLFTSEECRELDREVRRISSRDRFKFAAVRRALTWQAAAAALADKGRSDRVIAILIHTRGANFGEVPAEQPSVEGGPS